MTDYLYALVEEQFDPLDFSYKFFSGLFHIFFNILHIEVYLSIHKAVSNGVIHNVLQINVITFPSLFVQLIQQTPAQMQLMPLLQVLDKLGVCIQSFKQVNT